MPTISVVSPMLNEKRFLPVWLDNIKLFADEVVVIDGGSTDGSWEILQEAKKYLNIKCIQKAQTGRPYSNDWHEADYRNWLLQNASMEYVLSLDMDEALSDNFVDFKKVMTVDAYSFNFVSFWKNFQTIRINHPKDPRWSGNHFCCWKNSRAIKYERDHHCSLNQIPPYCIIKDVSLFHLHYAFGLKSEYDNRRGDLGCADGDISKLDWDYLDKIGHSYRALTKPYFGHYPLAVRNHFEFDLEHLSDRQKYQEFYDGLAKYDVKVTEKYGRISSHLEFFKGKILELGCGGGHVTKILAERADEVWAVDVSSKQIEIASERCKDNHNVHLFCAFAEDVDFDKDFDVVVLQEVLEHVKDDRLILSKAYEHIKPGGVISISVPSKGLWAGSGHIRYYTEDTLVRAIREVLGEDCFIDTREAGIWLMALVAKPRKA